MKSARRVSIRLPWITLLLPAFVLFCTLPIGTAGGWWALSYLVPAALFALVLYAGTVATDSALTARWVQGRTRIVWEKVEQIEFPGQGWARVVSTSGHRVVLPGVRPVDLPAIVSAAGGRLFLQQPIKDGESASASRVDDDAAARVESPEDEARDAADQTTANIVSDRAAGTDGAEDRVGDIDSAESRASSTSR